MGYAEFTQADVAQLVERHLAKVKVAGSSPVIRSVDANGVLPIPARIRNQPAPVPERTKGAACKAVNRGFKSRPAFYKTFRLLRSQLIIVKALAESRIGMTC